jgi:hypothetical protein
MLKLPVVRTSILKLARTIRLQRIESTQPDAQSQPHSTRMLSVARCQSLLVPFRSWQGHDFNESRQNNLMHKDNHIASQFAPPLRLGSILPHSSFTCAPVFLERFYWVCAGYLCRFPAAHAIRDLGVFGILNSSITFRTIPSSLFRSHLTQNEPRFSRFEDMKREIRGNNVRNIEHRSIRVTLLSTRSTDNQKVISL